MTEQKTITATYMALEGEVYEDSNGCKWEAFKGRALCQMGGMCCVYYDEITEDDDPCVYAAPMKLIGYMEDGEFEPLH